MGSGLTNAQFAQHCSRLAGRAASWAADILDEAPDGNARLHDVERFTDSIRERLNRIDELAGRSALEAEKQE